MTHAEYAAIDAVNWSKLKNMRDSALAYLHGLGTPRADTPDLALGRLTHALVFEPLKVALDFAIWEGGRRAGKEWEAFAAAHAHQTIVKPDEYTEAVDMALAVKRHHLVRPYLDDGEFERIVRWTDPITGLACKARPDWILPQRRILLDLKTARSAEARRFGIAAATLGYHCQMAHYCDGIEHDLGWRPQQVKFVVVEKAAPYDVAVFDASADDIAIGTEEVRALLQTLRGCIDCNTWLGRYSEEQPLRLPAYIHGEIEYEFE